MSTALIEASETKAKTRRAPRATARPVAPKVKVTLCLTDEVAMKLAIHAAALRVDRSDLVNELVSQHLKRFVVSDRSRATGDPVTDRQTDAA